MDKSHSVELNAPSEEVYEFIDDKGTLKKKNFLE